MDHRVLLAIQAAENEFGISADDIAGPCRVRKFCRPRFAVCLIAQEMKVSLPNIGRALSGRDHTSALNGIRRAKQLMEEYPGYRESVLRMRHAVKEPARFYRHGTMMFRSVRPAMREKFAA